MNANEKVEIHRLKVFADRNQSTFLLQMKQTRKRESKEPDRRLTKKRKINREFGKVLPNNSSFRQRFNSSTFLIYIHDNYKLKSVSSFS